MNILVTAGGTKAYIDGVRYIGNSSTGKTGALLSEHLSQQGHEVTWLGAKGAIEPDGVVQKINYETFTDLAQSLQQTLAKQSYDVVFQAAAVSDFKVESVLLDGQQFQAGRTVKLPTADEVQLRLTKQPKLVSALKGWSKNPNLLVVAFKLTNSMEREVRQAAVDKLIQQNVIDYVAHNDLNDFCENTHTFDLYSKQDKTHCKSIQTLSDLVIRQLELAA